MSADRLFRTLLWFLPGPFRHEYGAEMLRTFRQDRLAARRERGRLAETAVWIRSLTDLFLTAPQEHYHLIQHNLRYAVRTLRAQPGFTAVAVLSLALGIGANVGLFSLVNTVLLRLLPVRNPEELVLVTDGVSRGTSTGASSGDRSLLTYEEFTHLRDHASVFSQLMATYSPLEKLSVRVRGGEPEDVRQKMVSAEYFELLGVPPMLGRAFGPGDGPQPALAVISHDFWRRRFGAREDVLGATLQARKGVFTIAGVMPPGFFGEIVGDQPDVWFPLSMQPVLLPGRDWLRDHPRDLMKTIWLQVYGRLKPEVTLSRAQTATNAVFQQQLSAFYASAPTEEMRRNFLNQRLRLRPAGLGGSSVREGFGQPLLLMLAAAGVVLLIACANLGNLMLTRATARAREMAVRQALGAGRGALIRQWLTESMVIAGLGGLLGWAVGAAIRAGLLRLGPESIHLPAESDARLLLFTLGVTLLTGLALAILPVLRTMGINANAGLREQGRGLTASVAWLRAGKAVVMAQVALSLPLVVGAALLVRTLDNLQRVDFGYPTQNLLLVRVDTFTYPEPQRQALFDRLHERVRRVPGVKAAAYSPHGMMMGGDSSDEVIVQGYTRTGNGDGGSRYDPVSPGYFSTLGIPVKLGRALDERDHANSPRVCVINEAFAKKFFDGRNPLGQQVTQTYGHQRNTYEVVGVIGNARKNSLRREIEHRFYFPVSQPVDVPQRLTFLIRTAGEPTALANAVRAAIREVDPDLPINSAAPMEKLIEERTLQDRLLARLSLAFGVVALLLAGIGLYGVLSYGVARRTSEIGIRKALGASRGALVSMILRETSWLLAGGLALGAGLAYASLRWIKSQLFGLSPADPVAFTWAMAVLCAVGLAAATWPALRAARVDALVAIRHE